MEPTMRALIVDDFQIATFRAVEMPRPELTADRVLVRIKASGVNPIDSKIRIGKAPDVKPVLPAVLKEQPLSKPPSMYRCGQQISVAI
jgi:NADPH:quinone reductase